MQYYLQTTWFGTFLCTKKEIIEYQLFSKKINTLQQIHITIQNNQILPEEKQLVDNKKVIVCEKRLQTIGVYIPDDSFFSTFQIDAETYGYTIDLLTKIVSKYTEQKMTQQLELPDNQIIQMVNAYDECTQIANLLSERLDHWIKFPSPQKNYIPIQTLKEAVSIQQSSLEQILEKNMKDYAPNITQILGPMIGARLISQARSLQQLALYPASTVQILGAEKAFFRYKKEGGKPPKHGFLFQHQLINKAPKQQRGKIARLLAAKTSTAAKADAFTKRAIAKQLQEEIESTLKKIRKN